MTVSKGVKVEVRLAKASVGAFVRTSQDRVGVATSIADPKTRERLAMVSKPPNISKSLRNAGAILLISPDPFTAVPGAALLGASYVMKRREAANLQSLARETAAAIRGIRELQSLL